MFTTDINRTYIMDKQFKGLIKKQLIYIKMYIILDRDTNTI